MEEALIVLNQPKTLILPTEWFDVPNRKHKNPQRQIMCRVALDGAIRRGVFFRVRAFPAYPESMMFQLEVENLESRDHVVIYRLDFCPRSQHTNVIEEGREQAGQFFNIGETHEHIISDNLTLDRTRILINSDKFARKIDSPPNDFLSSVNYICDRIHLLNVKDLPLPQDQGLLL